MATTTRAAATRSLDAASGAAPFRSDIQGLRAVAVMGVLIYHLSPGRLSGGYVGVDVFFVISGFLITGHLLRRPVGSGRDLLDFWARRVRRLLPSAGLVLLATLAGAVMWLPVTVRSEVAREVIASATYVQNWYLAHTATDYLAADVPPGPLQHYWSLSIEEQFYLLWPVLMGALAWLAVRRFGRDTGTGTDHRDEGENRRRLSVAGIVLVLGVSLWWSASLTATEPGRAYFVSTTRVWELAAGGLLAATAGFGIDRLPPLVRVAAAWLGLGLIGWAMFTYDHTTAFPGLAALVPVGGTMLVIAAGVTGLRGGPGWALGWRPVTWTGDVSYSLYLWHWPLIVIAPFALGTDLTLRLKLIILAITFALAAATTKAVEDPLRRRTNQLRPGPTFGAMAIGLAVVVGSALAVLTNSEGQARAEVDRMLTLLDDPPSCLGAEAARNPDCEFPGDATLYTRPTFAREDRPVLYQDQCWNNRPFTDRRICHYGPEEATVRIALVGNSHAGHWHPAIASAMADRDWSLTTYLVSECYTVDLAVDMGDDEVSENCRAWNEWAVDEVTSGGFDLVVMSNRTARHLVGVDRSDRHAVAKESYGRVLGRITDADVSVLVIRDTPSGARNHPECVARHLHAPSNCATRYPDGLEPDPLAEAGLDDRSGKVQVLDVNHLLCRDLVCPAVVGGVIVFFDHGHLTATFATTLTPEVEAALITALG